MFAQDEYPIIERVFKFLCDVDGDPDIQTWVEHHQTSAIICKIINTLHQLGYEISPATPETVAAWEKNYVDKFSAAFDEGKSFLNALSKE